MGEAGAGSARPGGVTATVGGVVAPFLLIALTYAVLLWTSGDAGFNATTAAASTLLGILLFDVGVATGMAWARATGRGAGHHSPLVAITGSLWLIWLLMTGVPADDQAGWTASVPAVLAVGVIGLTGEVTLVRFLDRVGHPSGNRAGDGRS